MNLPEKRQKELREGASDLEGWVHFRHLLEKDPVAKSAPFLEERERLSNLFVMGIYALNYRRQFGEMLFKELISFHQFSYLSWVRMAVEEPEESAYFASCFFLLRRRRKAKLKEVNHLKLV